MTITNPMFLKYYMGELKISIFKNIPFMSAKWDNPKDIPDDIKSLVELTSNRMEFMLDKDSEYRRKGFVYFMVLKRKEFADTYVLSADHEILSNTDYSFIGYAIFRARHLKALSKLAVSKPQHPKEFDLNTMYLIPISVYDSAQEIDPVTITSNPFTSAYQTIKSNLISCLVSYNSTIAE